MPKRPVLARMLLIVNVACVLSAMHAKAPDLKICFLQGLLYQIAPARQESVHDLVLFLVGIHGAFCIHPSLVMLAGSWRRERSSCF